MGTSRLNSRSSVWGLMSTTPARALPSSLSIVRKMLRLPPKRWMVRLSMDSRSRSMRPSPVKVVDVEVVVVGVEVEDMVVDAVVAVMEVAAVDMEVAAVDMEVAVEGVGMEAIVKEVVEDTVVAVTEAAEVDMVVDAEEAVAADTKVVDTNAPSTKPAFNFLKYLIVFTSI